MASLWLVVGSCFDCSYGWPLAPAECWLFASGARKGRPNLC